MPSLPRPDGAEIHWEAQGDGPVVVLVHHTAWSYPGLYGGLRTELARDHRFVLYDPRGCGKSSRQGPYDPETDAADLSAVTEELGGGAVAIAVGDGLNRTARVAAARPDLISEVIAIAPAPAAFLPRGELKGAEVMAASEGVIEMLLKLMTTDPRAALRTLIGAVNPELDGEQLRERVERVADYIDLGAGTERVQAWLSDDISAEAAALGDRLWILHGGSDPMFEGALGERTAELYPRAQIEEIVEGPISRPEVTAAYVRRLTGARRT
jgi:pimeloyl-ACP methyl ester carboxylesterase